MVRVVEKRPRRRCHQLVTGTYMCAWITCLASKRLRIDKLAGIRTASSISSTYDGELSQEEDDSEITPSEVRIFTHTVYGVSGGCKFPFVKGEGALELGTRGRAIRGSPPLKRPCNLAPVLVASITGSPLCSQEKLGLFTAPATRFGLELCIIRARTRIMEVNVSFLIPNID